MTEVTITLSPSRLRSIIRDAVEQGHEMPAPLVPLRVQRYDDDVLGLILYGDSYLDRVSG